MMLLALHLPQIGLETKMLQSKCQTYSYMNLMANEYGPNETNSMLWTEHYTSGEFF